MIVVTKDPPRSAVNCHEKSPFTMVEIDQIQHCQPCASIKKDKQGRLIVIKMVFVMVTVSYCDGHCCNDIFKQVINLIDV